MRLLSGFIFWVGIVLVTACSQHSVASAVVSDDEKAAIEQLTTRWVGAVAGRDDAMVEMLSASSRAYYPRMQQLALHGSVAELESLNVIDQLQVLLLRLLMDAEKLQAMDDRELLVFAAENGLIGMDLRASDTLGDIEINGYSGQGRLYKFGLTDRPDRNLQYFVKEEGSWRIELQGELERLNTDFINFQARTGLPSFEAAFLILETRLMRKVTPDDLAGPLAEQSMAQTNPLVMEKGKILSSGSASASASPSPSPVLRLVAIRRPLNAPLQLAATVEDGVSSQKYVLQPGDTLPSDPRYTLSRIEGNAVVLEGSEGELRLALDPAGPPLTQRMTVSGEALANRPTSLLAQAKQGANLDGMMLQWRNVGLRDKPQLLQQAWLTPEYLGPPGLDREMLGLKVRKITPGSFWHQLGMVQGDVLKEFNGVQVNSMNAWQQVLEIAQRDLSVTLTVERAATELKFSTNTIRPR